jgi:hypothetical protein
VDAAFMSFYVHGRGIHIVCRSRRASTSSHGSTTETRRTTDTAAHGASPLTVKEADLKYVAGGAVVANGVSRVHAPPPTITLS